MGKFVGLGAKSFSIISYGNFSMQRGTSPIFPLCGVDCGPDYTTVTAGSIAPQTRLISQDNVIQRDSTAI